MTTTIAVAGKGGTGKTTLAGLLIRRLAESQAGPILAIVLVALFGGFLVAVLRSRRQRVLVKLNPVRTR